MLQGAETTREGTLYIMRLFPLLMGKGMFIFNTVNMEVVDMDSGPLPNSYQKKSNNKSGTIDAASWPSVPRRRFKNERNHYDAYRGEQIQRSQK